MLPSNSEAKTPPPIKLDSWLLALVCCHVTDACCTKENSGSGGDHQKSEPEPVLWRLFEDETRGGLQCECEPKRMPSESKVLGCDEREGTVFIPMRINF